MEHGANNNTTCPESPDINFSDLWDSLTDQDAGTNQTGVTLPPYSGNQRGGRPKKKITVEDLERCKGYTLKAAAVELKASESTLKRRIKDLTGYKTWTEFQQSPSVSQHAHGIERMPGNDKVVVILVNYGGIGRPFDLADMEEQSRFHELQKLIEQNLNIHAGTYVIKWFVSNMVSNMVLTISSNDNLKACFSLASKWQFDHISLTVENN